MSEAHPDSDTGETVSPRSPRFGQWVAFLAFSIITLGAAVEEKNTNASSGTALTNQRWAIACSAITFGFTAIMVGLHFHPVASTIVVGTKIEGAVILVMAAFWAGTVSIVSDARHGLAVSSDGDVSNGNLYYFSWAGFVCSVMLCVSYLRAVFGVDVASEIQNRSARLSLWSALLAAELIVMGSCANIFDQECAPRTTEAVTFCQRTKFGIAVGVIGTAFSLGVVGMKVATSQAPFLLEFVFAIFLVILNAFGVGYLTSPNGPGKGLGNLYYFSWISLLSSSMIGLSCFQDYKGGADADAGSSENTTDAEHKPGEIQVEPLEASDDV
mmetsp:Transcript_16531/g.37947  ORF Transcript_16531/g.37947 Transcript_16531/m.37947 type:complete len:327 (-) Transcript_16531:72-1052(-)